MSDESTQALEGAAVEPAAESSSPAIDSDVAPDTEAAPSPVEAETEVASGEPEGVVNEEPVLPEFDFEAWDGGIDDLPEMYHGMHGRMESIYNNRFSSIESELDQMRRLNDALMVGEEDPRVSEFQTKLEEALAAKQQVSQEFEQFKQQIEQFEMQEASEWADNFEREHKEIFENQEMREALGLLIENDWEPESAVKVLGFSEEQMRIAIESKRDGVPDKYAIRLAENAVRQTPKANPRPAAKITSGATTRSSPEQQMMDINETSTLDDKRMIVARRALKNARR
tara:strand:- start:422 stop:1273 length:852 start_codon:yes stop_codon:yes gene_type:complete